MARCMQERTKTSFITIIGTKDEVMKFNEGTFICGKFTELKTPKGVFLCKKHYNKWLKREKRIKK